MTLARKAPSQPASALKSRVWHPLLGCMAPPEYERLLRRPGSSKHQTTPLQRSPTPASHAAPPSLHFSFSQCSTTPFTCFTDAFNNALSCTFNGSISVLVTPCLPSTSGILKRHPSSSTQWLIVVTWRKSNSTILQMAAQAASMPYAVAPLAAMISYALFLVVWALVAWSSWVANGEEGPARGTPPIEAVDQLA